MSPEIADAVEQRMNFPEYIARLKAGATSEELGRDYGFTPMHPEIQRLMKEAGLTEHLLPHSFESVKANSP